MILIAHIFDYTIVLGFWLGLPAALIWYDRRESRRG